MGDSRESPAASPLSLPGRAETGLTGGIAKEIEGIWCERSSGRAAGASWRLLAKGTLLLRLLDMPLPNAFLCLCELCTGGSWHTSFLSPFVDQTHTVVSVVWSHAVWSGWDEPSQPLRLVDKGVVTSQPPYSRRRSAGMGLV